MTEEVTPTTASPVKEAPVYNVRQFLDADRLRKDLSISPADLNTAIIEQASIFAHYGMILADASRQVDVVELLLEQAEAAVYKLLRDQAAVAGEKITETMLEKQVVRHPRVVGFKRALNEAKRVESMCKTAVEAFRQRRDMLIQQGSTSREELKGELRIREVSARDQALEEKKAAFLASRNQ